mgnify:CR=1 FL=1
MEEDLKKFMENKSLPFKLKLFYNISLKIIESVNNNNSGKRFSFELDEIKSIQKLNNPYFLMFLYINKDKVHDKLYEEEEFLKIDFEIKDKKISQYIYLSFLIGDSEMCDYQYFFELINKLNDIQRGENGKILKKIIMAKVIFALVDNYNQIEDNQDNQDNRHKEELDKILEFNLKILDDKDNKIKLEQYKLKIEDIKSKKIEEIYLVIIKYLIENSKLEDSDYFESIINQIELESIILTKLMFDELIKIITKEKEYIKKYEIKNFEDIFDKKKINFYYNLIKYILKQSLYIYQIPFLSEARKTILNLIKNNKENISVSIKKNDYKNEFILKQFIGDNSYNYYYKASETIIKINKSHNSSQQSNNFGPNSSYINAPSVQEAHENVYNEFGNRDLDSSSSSPFNQGSYQSAKQKSNRSFDNDFENEEEVYDTNEFEYKILSESIFKLHTNQKGATPFIVYDEIKIIINKSKNENKTIEDIRSATTSNEKLSNNYKKFLSFLDNFENSMLNEFNKNNYNFKITLKFETRNINNNDFIITCIYEVELPGEEAQKFKDENILINGLGEGFQYMTSAIKSL